MYMKYNERIRALREDNDLKQYQIAELLHIGQKTYSDYELGRLNVPAEVLGKLADFYKTSVDYIMGRTDNMKPY